MIGLLLDPFTTLHRSFLKHCTPTNKAVGTIWRDLSKHPQRRQGPDTRPLWLLFGTLLVLGPELLPDGRNIAFSGGCLYKFLIYCFYHLTNLCKTFYDLSGLVCCWSSAFIRRYISKCLIVSPFDNTVFAVNGKVLDSVNGFNHTRWVAIVTPTDRPKSFRNPCVIEIIGSDFVLSRCFLELSVCVGAFVIGLSQIPSFFS